MASQRDPTSTTGGNGHGSTPDAPMMQKVSQAVEGTVDQARDKLNQAGEALRYADAKDVVRSATDYAQRGGRVAYDAVLDHPIMSSMIGALLGFGLYFGLRPDDSYTGRARSYARAAQDRWEDVDWDDIQDQAKDYARRARRQASDRPSMGVLPILVGLGVAYWLFSGDSRQDRNAPQHSTK